MNKVNILYTGRHPEILETVVRLINSNENWKGYGAGSNESAIELLNKINFDILLLGTGISKECEDSLRETFAIHNPKCKIVQHYGGGSGLLAGEIYEALSTVSV